MVSSDSAYFAQHVGSPLHNMEQRSTQLICGKPVQNAVNARLVSISVLPAPGCIVSLVSFSHTRIQHFLTIICRPIRHHHKKKKTWSTNLPLSRLLVAKTFTDF